jgi:hypothetical protein
MSASLTPRSRGWAALAILAVTLATATLAAVTPASAQFRGRPPSYPEGLPTRNGSEDRGWTFCRLRYDSNRGEALGQGWATDYPDADHNLMLRMSQLTRARISWWTIGRPGFSIVRPTDTAMYHCPFLFASDVGTIQLSAEEASKLRDYLLKGGFLWVDDFWGSRAWDQWESQITRVLPEFRIVDIPLDHPLLNYVYHVKKIPQVPSIQFWRRSGGLTSERGEDSAVPHLRGIFDDNHRLLVVITHNTDIADGWEREAEDDAFFYRFSWDSYALAVNIVMWSITH